MSLSADTTLKTLMENPQAMAVLVQHFGEKTKDHRIDQVLHETLRAVCGLWEAGISAEQLAAVDADLKAL